VSWNAVSGATSYNIYYSNAPGVTKSTGTKISAVTSPYVHMDLTAGTYYYVVTAASSAGESAASSEVSILRRPAQILHPAAALQLPL
jgi:hypothetical protein